MARRDASKKLGGMAGRAASALRGRGKALEDAIGGATGEGRKPSGGKARKIVIREKGKNKY